MVGSSALVGLVFSLLLLLGVVLLEHFLLFFVALVVNVLLVLDIQLSPLKVNVVDVEVVLMQLHMDHLLSFLVHFVFLQTLIDLVDLISHL